MRGGEVRVRSTGENDAEVIEGELGRIVYESPRGDFFVAVLDADDRGTDVRVVGDLAGARTGERLRCHGRWIDDARYGRQFRVSHFAPVLPTTRTGIERYLASAGIKGIGKKTATRIVAHFGAETMDVLTAAPDRLSEVPGLGRAKAELLRGAFSAHREGREALIFLQGLGLGPALARRVHRQYGAETIPIVRDNPYVLAREVQGIGFRIADRVGRALGYDLRSPERGMGAVLHLLEAATDDGHLFLTAAQIGQRAQRLEVDEDVAFGAAQQLFEQGEVLVEGDGLDAAVYLPKYHRAEVHSAERLERLLRTPGPVLYSSAAEAISEFETKTGLTLAPGQRQAITRALDSKVFVLTGGPGTGKTTLIQALLTLHAGRGLRVDLAAPTGRAAKRLEEAAGQRARTIHRLLEWSPRAGGFQRNQENPLPLDTLIVDEASMIDLPLFNALVRALPASARLVLVGDVDQLPSVGAGDVLRDVIVSGVIPVARLSEIFRQSETSAIVRSAHRVNRGEMPALDDVDADFFHVERPDGLSAAQTILDLVERRIPQRFGFDPFEQIQVLSPMHKGHAGVERLNQALQAALNPAAEHAPSPQELLLGPVEGVDTRRTIDRLRVGDKVIQTKNSYDKDVFNGDVGRVQGLDAKAGRVVVRFDGRDVPYEGESLEDLQLAYALSVHKAQGSEYPAVVLSLQREHFPMLQRNLLYTAITRGRRLVVIVGSKRALERAVENAEQRERNTRFAQRLRAAVLSQE
jgi:exodeoxyribonuclease V alpha subunit